jgi:thioredoxin-related protein
MKHLLILSLTLLFSIPFGAQAQWFTDYNAALKKAQAENKSVLINFTGSDWCPPCMRLKAEVFDKYEFKKYAHDNLILLEIDFPRRIDQPPGVRAANQKQVSVVAPSPVHARQFARKRSALILLPG